MSFRVVLVTERRGRVFSSFRILDVTGHTSPRVPTILTEVFRGFHNFFQANDSIMPQIRPRPLLRSFLIYYYHPCYHLYAGYLQLYTLKQTVFLGYTMLQLFCIDNLCYILLLLLLLFINKAIIVSYMVCAANIAVQ